MQDTLKMSLPVPDAESAAHSERVARYIRDKITAAGGLISFAEFMHHALYARGLGYYSAGTTKFGAAGDFITAPEVSPIFGRVLARQCASVRSGLDEFSILEVSAELRERQERLLRRELPDLFGLVSWLDRLPDTHGGVVVANEVLDAMPVERFIKRGAAVAQLCVATEGDRFVMRDRVAPRQLAARVAEIERDVGRDFPDGYVSELRQGYVFLFDYGVSRSEYYSESRSDGWLRCHFRHRAHSKPLILPGIQDITSWVDFSAVASAAVDSGFEVAGFVTQAQFLLGGGLTDELLDMANLPLTAQLELSTQVKKLTLPGEMGENFKCLGLMRGTSAAPTAFAAADRAASL
jgi:SAM-dependent MidA family methyltransferase